MFFPAYSHLQQLLFLEQVQPPVHLRAGVSSSPCMQPLHNFCVCATLPGQGV